MNISLRTRMMLLALAPAALVAALLSGVFVWYSVENLEQELRTRGTAIARQISIAAEYGIFSGQRESLLELTRSALRIDPDARGAAVLDVQGEVMARSGDLHPGHWSATKIDGLRVERDVLLFVEPVLRSNLPVDDIYAGGETPRAAESKAIGHVVIELSPGRVSRKSQWLLAAGVLVGFLAMAFGGWLALRIAREVTKPLMEANAVVARIGEGDLTVRMTIKSAGALRVLAAGINDMTERIGVTQEDLRARIAQATHNLQQEKEVAEHATIAKSHFLAAASHDLRQPLHALGLFVSGLARSEAAKLEPKLVKRIQMSVDALQTLLDSILDISRLDRGNLIPEISPFPMAKVLDRLPRGFLRTADQKGLKLKVRQTQLWVKSDEKIVERILRNLVGNALRYTHAGGVLVVCRHRCDVLRVEVWDTGEGIPGQALKDIFKEYTQMGNPERDRAKGLGLGLAICRRLADLLAIPMAVRSRLGRGSVFWIELPVAQQDESGVLPAMEISQVGPLAESVRLSGTILVVERDALVRAGMEQAILSWGGRVVLAENREEALRYCRESDRPPDLIICNIRLPGLVSGIDLAQELQREFQRMGVLLVSADVSAEAQSAARRAGFALLAQPVPPGRLRAALQQMLAVHATNAS